MTKIKLTLALLTITVYCNAQSSAFTLRHNLDRRINLEIKQEPVSEVLHKMSKAGDFFFSYSGTLFKQDSIVNIKLTNTPVRNVLDLLFNGKVDYKEMGEYIILRYAANRLTIEPENITTAEKLYLISGYVVDTETGRKVKQASVYEKRLLQSALTDDDGYFRLRFKGDHSEVMLTASKETYRDTTLIFLSDIKVRPEGYRDKNSDERANSFFNSIENSGISRFFISSRQRIQSLNIPDFFANSPFQASLTPGLSSHGIMSSQVVNKVSLNVLGGYTAGTDGFEIAGLFNITKGDVKKFQAAGLFNGVGGSVGGIQLAGLFNDVRFDLQGFQAAGLVNRVKESSDGFQVAGLANIVSQEVKGTQAAGLANISLHNFSGVQIAGLTNFSRKKTRGTQIAGLGNISIEETDGLQIAGLGNYTSKSLNGMQISGLFNYAKEMNGVQIGLINISDNSTGYSIGLINYVKHGYRKISISSNETINTNVAFKMGNAKLYNILFVGENFSDTERIETAGFGFGHDFIFNNKLSVAGEYSSQYLYLGNWDYANFLNRFQANLQYRFMKGVTLFCGPVYSVYTSEAPTGSSGKGYKQQVAPAGHHKFTSDIKGWFGWNAGITIM